MNQYFDGLPWYKGRKLPEPVFAQMVRYILGQRNCECAMSKFGRNFPGAEQVLLMLFFNVSTPSHGRCNISLRFTIGTHCGLVKAHIENRLELTCKHGRGLIKDRTQGVWQKPSISKVTCFPCNVSVLGEDFYSCKNGCVLYICSACMVFKKADIEPPPDDNKRAIDPVAEQPAAKRISSMQAAAEADASSTQAASTQAASTQAASSTQPAVLTATSPASRRPVVIFMIKNSRGHVLRSGDRLSENLQGDWADLRAGFKSIKLETEKMRSTS